MVKRIELEAICLQMQTADSWLCVLRMRNLSKPNFGHVMKPNLTLAVWGNLTKAYFTNISYQIDHTYIMKQENQIMIN